MYKLYSHCITVYYYSNNFMKHLEYPTKSQLLSRGVSSVVVEELLVENFIDIN